MLKPLERILAPGQNITSFKKRLPEIEAAEQRLAGLDISAEAERLRRRARDEGLDQLLPDAFALTRLAAAEAIGQSHYPEQMIGGQVIASGGIAEMKTGEGKTLTATLPAFLWSLTEEPVHLVTANDYLARRDCEWMGPVFELLGLSTAFLDQADTPDERQEKYRADVVYGTAPAFGFDFLRDRMVLDLKERRQRELGYVLIDEADSILIDDARTPLIISGQVGDTEGHYAAFAQAAAELEGVEHRLRLSSKGESADTSEEEYDYEFDQKHGTVALTEHGVARAEEILGVENLYLAGQGVVVNQLLQAVRARALYHRDHDYAVIDGKVRIIDESTGRVLESRRWSEGLHQAIEAKEGLELTRESQMMATITLPNYFKLYQLRSGMTGTAMTDSEEFQKIYGLVPYAVPTHRPVARIDHTDLIFKSARGKRKAVVNEIKRVHETGQPVLAGTTSVEKSEALSRALDEAGVEHQVLNANPEHAAREAEVIAQAGRLGAVTVATNMAGRGIDIRLGGDPEHLALMELESEGADADSPGFQAMLKDKTAELAEVCASEADRVCELGGLMIIGTERHDSRRIDDQLRGRAGRQGDPGASRFYVSAEDPLIRHYSGERMKRAMRSADPDQPVAGKLLSRAVANAQKTVEKKNFLARKRLREFDDVLGRQREVIYERRDEILEGRDISDLCRRETRAVFERLLETYMPENDPGSWDVDALSVEAGQILPRVPDLRSATEDPEQAREILIQAVDETYRAKEAELGSGPVRHVERGLYLRALDHHWREHIYEMDYLRRGIGLRGIAGANPLIAYGNEGLEMFEEMLSGSWTDFARLFFHTKRKTSD